jgi:hypothetical protein
MAGKLVQVATETVTSAVASVTLTGIDSDDVYMLAYNNLVQASDNQSTSIRFIDSGGSAITDSEYDTAQVNMCADTSFRKINGLNGNKALIVEQGGANANELSNGILYIYNANNSSEYTFFSNECNYTNTATNLRGGQGGGVLTSAEQVTGISILINSGNIEAGTFTLYRVV